MNIIVASECEAISAYSSIINFSNNTRKNEFCHNDFELICFIRGNGRYLVEGQEYSVCENSVLAVRPLAYHCAMPCDSDELEFVSVRFTEGVIPAAVFSVFKKMLPDEDQSRFYQPSPFSDDVICAFERFSLANSLPEDCRSEYLKAITSEIILLLSSSAAEGVEIPDRELGAKVIAYLNANIDKNISLDRLARKFFVSKYYLCRAFKKYCGTSVHSYINHKRIMYAKQLIDSGETASKAAFKVGFGDYSAFYRAYVKILGKSPTAQ